MRQSFLLIPSALPPRPNALHTTGSAPLPPPHAPYGPPGPLGPRPSRIPKPPAAGGTPQPGPRGGDPNGSSYGYGSGRASAGGVPAAAAPPQDAAGTARRLAFSPTAPPRPGVAGSQPIPIAGHQRRPSWGEQQGAPAGPQYGAVPYQHRGAAGLPRHGGRQSPAPTAGSVPYGGSLAGSTTGPGSLQLASGPGQLLGMPARSGLAGRWVREVAPPGGHDGTGGGGIGGASEDGAADVDFLLQIPPLQAAARERTRELQARRCLGSSA